MGMLKWYALRTKAKKERFVYQQLVAQRVTLFFPAVRVKPVNPRAARIRPYFPGYLFIQADLDVLGQNAFSWLPGVVGLVQFGGEPAVVPDKLIAELRARLAALSPESRDPYQPGERVRIVEGPFAGYEAIFDLHLPGKERVQVLLSFLSNYPQPLKLHMDQIVKVR